MSKLQDKINKRYIRRKGIVTKCKRSMMGQPINIDVESLERDSIIDYNIIIFGEKARNLTSKRLEI